MTQFNYQENSKSSGIYVIFNNLNWRIYVGSCKRFKERWHGHLWSLRGGKHYNKFIQADFLICGEAAFEFHILELMPNSTKEERLLKEEQWIAVHYDDGKQCYNFCKKPTSSEGYKYKNPEEVKQKMSDRMKKLWQNIEHREKIKKYGIEHVDEFKKNCHTKESYEKIATGNSKYYGKILDPNGDVFEIQNLELFSRIHSLNRGNLQKVIEGKMPSCKGWRKYEEKLFGIPYIRNKSHREKSFSIIDPDGNIRYATNITVFAAEYGLSKENLGAVIRGTRKSHKGWTRNKDTEILNIDD